ncbi:MAG: MFS transporter [Clostridia bacterium]
MRLENEAGLIMNVKRHRIYLFCMVTSLYWFSLYAYVPTLPGYAESMGASYQMVGLIIGSYGFTQMILRIPLGILSDGLNRRRPFVIGGLRVAVVAALGMWMYPNPSMLLVFRGMTGVAAATWVAYTVLFSSYFPPEEAPRAIGYISAFNAVGQMAGMMLGGTAAQHFGQGVPFLVAMAGGIVGLVLSFGIVEQRSHREPGNVADFLSVGKDRGLLMVSFLAILVQIITFSTVYGFTPIAAERIGASSFGVGLLATLSTLPRVIAAPLSGAVFAPRFGDRRTIAFSFLVLALSCGLIPFIHYLPWLYITQVIGGFATGLILPLLMGLSIKTVPDGRRASAMGFFQAIYGLGMFAGPVFVGAVSDALQLSWGFWLVGAIGLLAAIYAITLWGWGFPTADPEESSR